MVEMKMKQDRLSGRDYPGQVIDAFRRSLMRRSLIDLRWLIFNADRHPRSPLFSSVLFASLHLNRILRSDFDCFLGAVLLLTCQLAPQARGGVIKRVSRLLCC